jgi:RND family efflux transporter MFP subunit
MEDSDLPLPAASLDLPTGRPAPANDVPLADRPREASPAEPKPRIRPRAVPMLVTMIALILACIGVWAVWRAYIAVPWTRDGTVRAYVVTIEPEVSGRIVQLPVTDNQFVYEGDLLMVIDPTDYALALEQAQAATDQASAVADNAKREAERRANLTTLESSNEEKQTYRSNASAAVAAWRLSVADLARARVNLARTTIRSPVNGYVTNLQAQTGDYATSGHDTISLVNADSCWIDDYFEETSLGAIHPGDRAAVKLMGYRAPLLGHVASIARGITVANAAPGQSGLADVNPIFTWVRLAQRVPVRFELDRVPAGVRLVAGQTASIAIISSTDDR